MSKESLYSSDSRIVFRETFNSYDDVAKNGGTNSNTTISNGSAYFNGSNTSISYVAGYLNNTTNITIEAKIKVTSFGNRVGIVSKRVDDNNIICMQVHTGGIIYVDVDNASNSYGYTAAILSTNVWYNLVMVYNGAGTGNGGKIQLYVNGVAQTLTFSGTIASKTPNNSSKMTIGQLGPANTNYFNGYIDYVNIYKASLTAEEVQSLYSHNLYKAPNLDFNTILDINPNRGNFNDKKGNIITNSGCSLKRSGNTFVIDKPSATSYLRLTSLTTTGNLSINLWVKSNFSSASTTYILYDASGLKLFAQGNTTMRYWFRSDGTTNSSTGNLTLKDGLWVNLIITRTALGITNFYLNGSPIGTLNQNSGIPIMSTPFYLGGPSSSYIGSNGITTIYNKILSQLEITRLYNSQKGLYE